MLFRDNGIGMSEEFQKKLFDPFSQEDDANARTQYKGTGLGMAITKKYVDMMGGSIDVESKKGVGFYIHSGDPTGVARTGYSIRNKNNICIEI